MVLRYTGLAMDGLYEGMLVTVPTNWDTSSFGHVTEDAWHEISDSLERRGIYLGSRRRFNHVYSSFSDGCNDSFLTFWEKA